MGCAPSGANSEALKKAQGLLQDETNRAGQLQQELQASKKAQDEAKQALDKANEALQSQREMITKEQKEAGEYRNRVMQAEAEKMELKGKLEKQQKHVAQLEEEAGQIRMQKSMQAAGLEMNGAADKGLLSVNGGGAKGAKASAKAKAKSKGAAKAKAGANSKITVDHDADAPQVNRANLIRDHDKTVPLSTFYQFEGDSLGEGAFGTVRAARHKKSKEVRAVKQVPVAKMSSLEREISLMKLMDHLNVIRLYETFMDNTTLYLVMELCDGGELFATIIDKNTLSEFEAAITMQQVFRAIHHMHERRVVHRDLKPENLMLQGKGDVTAQSLKVIDLGLAVQFSPGIPLSLACGTPFYMAPEQIQGKYDNAVDMWACGCIMYILLSGCLPFGGADDDVDGVYDQILEGFVRLDPDSWSEVSPDAQNLTRWMLGYVPQGRATAQQSLQHEWVTTIAPQSKHLLPGRVLKNLRNNRQRNLLKKAALQVIALNMSKEQLAKLPDIFMSLDLNQNGMLSCEELWAGLEKIQGGDASWLLTIMPEDGSDISYTEFIAAAMDKAMYMQKDVCMAAFQTFDRDGNGTISPCEIREVLGGGGGPDGKSSTDNAIAGILHEVDKSGDGVIDFEEFMDMMRAVGKGSIENVSRNPGVSRQGNV